jgi:phage baseplate assembly protein gpV
MHDLVEMALRIAELERKFASMVVVGTVHSVDTKAGTARLEFGSDETGAPFLGPDRPYSQVAGAIKSHCPPSIGQQMVQISPGGDWKQAFHVPLSWSDANASPGDGPDPAFTYRDVRVDVSDGRLRIAVGDAAVELTGSAFKMLANLVQAEGSSLKHNAKEVGDQHGHVSAPPGPPGPPV